MGAIRGAAGWLAHLAPVSRVSIYPRERATRSSLFVGGGADARRFFLRRSPLNDLYSN